MRASLTLWAIAGIFLRGRTGFTREMPKEFAKNTCCGYQEIVGGIPAARARTPKICICEGVTPDVLTLGSGGDSPSSGSGAALCQDV
jgi:hypothetical protein